MTIPRLALLTIGQSPRHDMSEAIEANLPEQVQVIHAGLLDGIESSDVTRNYAIQPGRSPLISRLRDGQTVHLDPSAVAAGLQNKLDALEEDGADIIVLLCTGRFPTLHSKNSWLVEPDNVVPAVVASVMGSRRLGVIVPLQDQIPECRAKWDMLKNPGLFAAASPYEEVRHLVAAARDLVAAGADGLALDCMGYSETHKAALKRSMEVPVFVSGSVLASALTNLI